MSRAYRIKVTESLHRIICAEDRVSTHLELLHVLPQDQMAELLAAELQRRGFERQDNQLARRQDDIDIVVDPAEGTVTVQVSTSKAVDLKTEGIGWAADDDGKHAKQARAALKSSLQHQLEREAGEKEAELQSALTDRLEAQLADLRKELNEVANQVTAAALKRKASQMGQIKEITEDPQSGSMTIVLEV